MKILAIDQSSAVLGISFFEEGQLKKVEKIKVPKNEDINDKIHNIKIIINNLYDKLSPDIITLEDIQQQLNVNTYKVLAELLGVLIEFCIERKIRYEIVHPKTWKSYCGIKGKKRDEQKKNTILFVKDKFGVDVGEDEADSICIGFYSVSNFQITELKTEKVPKIRKNKKNDSWGCEIRHVN